MSESIDPAELLVLRALKNFQLIELFLKVYLSRRPDPESKQEGAVVPSPYSYSDVEDLPLGALLKRFKSHNNNRALQDQLALIKDDRNMVAHRALIYTNPTVANLAGMDYVLSVDDLRRIDRASLRCFTQLTVEYLKVLGRSVPNPTP